MRVHSLQWVGWMALLVMLEGFSTIGKLGNPRMFSQSVQLRSRSEMSMSSVLGGLSAKMGSVVQLLSGQTTITASNIEATVKELKTILLDADVNLQVATSLLDRVKEKALGMKVEKDVKPGVQFISLLAAELVTVMGEGNALLARRTDSRPTSILLLGLQGAGKTTVAAKLAKWVSSQSPGRKILLVAADVYRPAAVEQLQLLSQRLSIDVYTDTADSNPVAICQRALRKAGAEGYDTVIFDTAGRQVIDAPMMKELKQIKAAIGPDEVLLVVDAMTGQEAATLTARFHQEVGLTGAVLTKLDGDSRGGAALSVRGVSGQPIKFIGVGEGMEDLEPFYPERMASRILGMGDIASLLEKAQSAMDADEAGSITRRMQQGAFDFNDYLYQSRAVKKMGGMSSVLKMIPGMAGKVGEEQLFDAEKRLRLSESIVAAMTDQERAEPDLIVRMGGKKEEALAAAERRRRLAKDTGATIQEIDYFVAQFTSMRKMMAQTLKGVDIDAAEADPSATLPPLGSKERAVQQRKERKQKPSRGGGTGFGQR